MMEEKEITADIHKFIYSRVSVWGQVSRRQNVALGTGPQPTSDVWMMCRHQTCPQTDKERIEIK